MELPDDRFKRRLLAGEVQYGLFCGLADGVAAEIVAGAGFDWLLLDGEHSPNDLLTILAQLRAVAASGTPVLVRPEVGDTVTIKRLLDVGARNLLVPTVESGAQAAALVAAVRYPPAEAAESAVQELGHHDSASIVARFDPRSRVKVADDVTIAVDTTRIQFFDLDTGLAIWN